MPRAKLGTNRISNLCLACEKCNQRKGTKDITETAGIIEIGHYPSQ